MKAIIKTDQFKEAISKIISVADKKNTKPILGSCRISVKTDHLEIVATDLEVAVKIRVRSDVQEKGEFCINAKNLFEILREMPGNESIDLSIDENQNILKINCLEINISLLICSSQDFPYLAFENRTTKFKLPSAQVTKFIYITHHSISTDETRPFLNGIFFQKLNSKLRVVATDGHRLAMIDGKEFNYKSETLDEGFIIPRKGVSEIKKLADSFPQQDIEFSVDNSFLYLSAENTYFLSIRLIAKEFPKYDTVIPDKTKLSMLVNKNVLLTAVKRMRLLANEHSNAIKFLLKEDKLTLSANHSNLGMATERIDVSYTGKELNLGINAKYLVDAISSLEGPEISFELNDEFGPILIKAKKLPEFLGIIMPLKL